jgi:two-component system phosphate regulon sensor histidine kinase PhoR
MTVPAGRRPVLLVALIAVLLPALAVLQYKWLGELSGLEQIRAQTNIRAATARFSQEFDAQLAGVYMRFYGGASPERRDGAHPEFQDIVRELTPAGLVKRIYLIERGGNGAFTAWETDATGREIGVSAWPEWLGSTVLTSTAGDAARQLPQGLSRTLLDEVPAIVVRGPADTRDRWVVVVLDLDRIVHDLLPAMLAGCFEGGIPVDYDVLVIRDDLPDQVVYRSRRGLTRANFPESLTAMPVFAIHGRDLDATAAAGLMPDAAAHRWRMLIQPQSGALEAAVGAARSWNLAIGIGVLALLAVSVVLLIFSMHSMQRAAREQLELIARISHELRTPLATITCAGENLADNLVETPADTRHYGQLIKREGRRLTRTLGDILLCCRLQARPDAVLNLQPTDVTHIIDRAVGDTVAMAQDEGVHIDTSVDAELPFVLADGEALRMALKNLIVNAIKYGQGHPVQVSARTRRTAAGVDIWITVQDQGPGIPADERSRIFEPFYRGRDARNLEIEGSGIGLSIVRQVIRSHGGHIRVSSDAQHGTRFTMQLHALKPNARVPVDPAA